ncbi:MAG: Peptidase M16 domain protein [Candidatus Moranbacteria bacterium GW2011_GWF2_34_56]|nr:MAG: Peptidase M16 domain protein [Candidatus Moranbacteria bacterium GW2011_GWF1_34_10]KKP64672.1 MAG: Peptidase M16 domain protein [Candidatus Moranbacteria bacterium GW2011_GWF2_34_56]
MNYKKTLFKNGLRLITAPMKDTQTATVMVMVGVGSRYEEDKERGISHFIEHMMFKGTKKRPNTQIIANELDAIGGEFNAFTGKTATAYYAKSDAKHLDITLDVISDMFLNSKLETKEIEKERGTILQELNMYEDMPMRSVDDVFESLLYGDQKLGREIIGTKETISNVVRKDFVNYIKKFYVATDTVICVAGKFDENKIIKKIEKIFSQMNQADKPDFEKVVEKQKTSQIKIKNKKTDQTHLILGARAYEDGHEDEYVLSLLSIILGGNMSSRIFINVRERQGLAYYVHTGSESYQEAGYLATSAGVEHKNLNKAVETILKEYKKISSKKVTPQELQKAKDFIKGKSVMGLESSDSVASFLIGQEVRKDKILTPEEIFKKIDKVTAEDILRVAKDIFKNEKLNLALIGPHKKSKELEEILKF